ncbi:protein hu-li tai shao isoform X1 [Aethina tumida]|uniref:protein hu-li tai shao isoform X1 n=1 Tax=Aethina tumida TaxID=116153 RepID=UPI00096B1720|nr:protein hu-li tai shao isoform X1 [Aethina tumida]
MTDTSQAELPPQTNGVSSDGLDEDERAKMRPADIDQDVREMERRKRVESIMNSRLFREELERIIESQMKDGTGPSGLLQQISDMVGVNKQAGNVFKNSSCVIPINDIRGIEAMGYAKGEKILRCKLASVFRLIDLYGWTQGASTLITARLNQDDEQFLVNPYGMLFHELTASSLIKIGMQGNVIEQGTTNFSVNITAFSLHAAVHAARPDIKCIIHVHTPSVVAISALKHGLLPLSQESVVIGEVSTHTYLGGLLDPEEKDKLARNLGPNNKVLLLSNQGALCCGETIEEAFFNARNTVLASESQLKLLPLGLDNLVLLNDEIRKKIYDAAHRAPESTPRPDQPSILEGKVERKWRVGGIEFEALMRMLDNAGFRTGYIYRHPLVKGEPPKPKNDVELPPAVSSLGYLLEEEELYRQGLWRKLEGGKKGQDRSRWLNSPNVYQKVEILETGTSDPKKITKWVSEGSPTHSSTPVKIDSALQFVPKGTNPKEFKQKQREIKEYRISQQKNAGPQSHILEGVTWEEARKMQDATVTQTGDHVVLMGAASKGIIQRGHQHNATVYKSPYAKNPFDSVTDEELDEYKKVVERKHKGDFSFTDDTTDYSESEGLSSAQINKRIDNLHIRSPTSETEEESRDEPQILRIETKQAPRPSQPEVVLSDVEVSPTEAFLRSERTTSLNSNRSENTVNGDQSDAHMSTLSQSSKEDRSISEGSPKKDKKKKKGLRTPSFLKKKKEKKIREA